MSASSTDETDLGSRRGLSCNHRHSETFPGFANWESDLQRMVLFTYTARPPPQDTDRSFRKTMKSLIAIAETGMSLVSQDSVTQMTSALFWRVTHSSSSTLQGVNISQYPYVVVQILSLLVLWGCLYFRSFIITMIEIIVFSQVCDVQIS